MAGSSTSWSKYIIYVALGALVLSLLVMTFINYFKPEKPPVIINPVQPQSGTSSTGTSTTGTIIPQMGTTTTTAPPPPASYSSNPGRTKGAPFSCPGSKTAGNCIIALTTAQKTCDADPLCVGYGVTTDAGWNSAYNFSGAQAAELRHDDGKPGGFNSGWSFFLKPGKTL